MKIVKLTARMFDTYGMENILLDAFKRHYKNYITENSANLSYNNNLLWGGKIIVLGTMRIGNLLREIIAKHGEPKQKDYPNLVTFVLVHSNHHWARGKNISGFFWQNPSTKKIYIGKVVETIEDEIKHSNDSDMKHILHHELQHLIRHMYQNVMVAPSAKNEVGSIGYYSSQTELQAFCAGLARTALNRWIDVTEYAMRNWSPERILLRTPEWREPKNIYSTFNVFVMGKLMGTFRMFDDARKNIVGNNEELKKKYLYYTFRNFEDMMNKYLDLLEQKSRAKLSEVA